MGSTPDMSQIRWNVHEGYLVGVGVIMTLFLIIARLIPVAGIILRSTRGQKCECSNDDK